MKFGLNAVIHGPSGAGKSWLGDTTPGPRLSLDAEGGSRFAPSQPKVPWDIMREAPPTAEQLGEDGTAIAPIHAYEELEQAYNWLASGQHPFRSVVLDQLTEIQMRMIAHFNGTSALRESDWGTLLRHMDDLVRKFRDLALHPVNPLDAVVFIVATTNRNDKWLPMLQGSMRDRLAYYVDLVGYLWAEQDPTTGEIVRRMLTQPVGNFEAKDRTHVISQTFGAVIDDPNFTTMLEVMNR